jgi:hypothetical protein
MRCLPVQELLRKYWYKLLGKPYARRVLLYRRRVYGPIYIDDETAQAVLDAQK